jgi:hypothetical protein
MNHYAKPAEERKAVFKPFVIETYGAMGAHATGLIKIIAASAREADDPMSTWTSREGSNGRPHLGHIHCVAKR